VSRGCILCFNQRLQFRRRKTSNARVSSYCLRMMYGGTGWSSRFVDRRMICCYVLAASSALVHGSWSCHGDGADGEGDAGFVVAAAQHCFGAK